MKIKKLLSLLPLTMYSGNKETSITGVTSHSKLVHPGNLFIAKKGLHDDGSKYIDEAIQNGATAILSDMPNPFHKHIVQLIHPNVNAVEGAIAAHYYEHPSKELFTVGITGTSGKTSTSYILKSLLDANSCKTGLIGTIEYVIGDARRPASKNTTPDVHSNHKMLREMVLATCQGAVLEVTSHALTQGRVNHIDFAAAVYTNLSHDHLDYHETMEKYAEAKSLLFQSLKKGKTAIINGDCLHSQRMIEGCKGDILTYGFAKERDLRCTSYHLTPHGTTFTVEYRGKSVVFTWNHIGKHNIYNALAALGVMVSRGVSLATLSPCFKTIPTIPGRLERVGDSLIFVDYAHKPDALEKVLSFLSEIKGGKLITVFGCGGDRDQKKRPLMAKIAETYSDLTLVTSDNPRSEDPMTIISDIVSGFSKKEYLIEPDRKEAIRKAISLGKKEDLILIAGKGHENYQIFCHQTIPFDDRKIALECL